MLRTVSSKGQRNTAINGARKGASNGNINDQSSRFERTIGLKAMLSKFRLDFAATLEENSGTKDHSFVSAMRRVHGQAFIQEAVTFLTQAGEVFNKTAYCYTCRQDCAIHPPKDIRGSRHYMNIGGNVCLPWSLLGTGSGWLSDPLFCDHHQIPFDFGQIQRAPHVVSSCRFPACCECCPLLRNPLRIQRENRLRKTACAMLSCRFMACFCERGLHLRSPLRVQCES